MTVDVYKQRVIDLFRSGKASDKQYEEMAACVLYASETTDEVPNIDMVINAD